MKKPSHTIDWNNVICHQCGHTFVYKSGIAAPDPEIPGNRYVMCSRRCAAAWLGNKETA